MQLQLQSYEWSVSTNKDDENEIHSWCLDGNSKSYLIRIRNYHPSVYLELPSKMARINITWTNEKISQIKKWIADTSRNTNCVPMSFNYVRKQKFYFYKRQKKNDFLELKFKNEEQMRKFSMKFSSKKFIIMLDGISYSGVEFNVWENNIPTVRKFLTEIELKHCEWFTLGSFEKVSEDDKISSLENELVCNFRDVKRVDYDGVLKPKILVFDIECYTDNHKAMPNALHSRHVITMISVIYEVLGDVSTRKRYLLTFSPVYDFEGTNIIRSRNEIDMLKNFAELVNYLDPDIITGYNIFGFDFKYIIDRMDIKKESWPTMGRFLNNPAKRRDIEWNSSAYGVQFLTFLSMPGRIVLDMLTIIRREYKYDKYDLGFVSSEMLGKTKHDVTAQEMFKIYEELINSKTQEEKDAATLKMTRVAKYCIQDSELVIDLVVKTNTWIGLTELANIVSVNVFDLFTRGQQVRCISQMYDVAHKKGYVLDTREIKVNGYKGAFVCEPNPGIYKYTICLDFRSLYPSIIMAFNICFTTLIPENMIHLYDENDYEVIECEEIINDDGDSDDEEDELFEVKKKKTKKEDKLTVMKKYYYWKGEQGILPFLVQELVRQRGIVKNLLKKEDPKSLMGIILDKRQNALKVSANSMYGFLGSSMGRYPLPEAASSITSKGRQLIHQCYDYLINTYQAKIIYGDTDSVMFTIDSVKNNKETIEFGNRMEKEVSSLFKDPLYTEFEKAGTMLCIKKKKYVFWTINMKTFEMSTKESYNVRCGNEDVTREMINKIKVEELGWDKEPKRLKRIEKINIVIEDVVYEVTKEVTLDMIKKGIVPSRRDNCRWQREFYMRVMDDVMETMPFNYVYKLIESECLGFLRGEVNHKNLVIIKTLGPKYKSDSAPMKVFSDILKSLGKPPVPGDRLEYVIVVADEETVRANSEKGKLKMGYKMKDPQTFTLGTDHIDYYYYIDRFIKDNIQQFFQICYKNEIEEINAKREIYDKKMRNIMFGNFLNDVYECIKTKDQEKKYLEAIKNTQREVIVSNLIKIRGIGAKVKKLKSKYLSERIEYFSCYDCGEPITNLLKIHRTRENIQNEFMNVIRNNTIE